MASNTSKIIFWVAVSAIAAGGAYIAYKQLNKGSGEETKDKEDPKKGNNTNTGGGNTGGGGGTTSELPKGEFPLKFGDKNLLVIGLQKTLNKKYGSKLVADGSFGQKTADVLCKNYFDSCFSDIQSRAYQVTAKDFLNLSK